MYVQKNKNYDVAGVDAHLLDTACLYSLLPFSLPPPPIPKHQGSTVTEHPLEEIWMEHIVPVEGILHSIHNM